MCKGAWWMPWHQEPMKDVGACDKPRGVGNRMLIRGCPNGETRHLSVGGCHRVAECIGFAGVERGSETSQYLFFEKTNVIPCVVASDSG